MNSDERPDPDALLQAITETETQEQSGKLRLFLGMSAGVGKTYAMLKAGHQRLNEGCDIVIGVVETHGRSETAALIVGLPVIERKKIEYRGTFLEEMDLEQILMRKPDLVIVDELAHTNAPGSRHEKRYQDVLEILEAGIDVYTALNVQHLESRKDSVEAITGIQIRETVPDSILEHANLVELVDIGPSELLKRLKDGKVYLGDKAERAEQNFFKEDKLTALREIALRMTAERVDQDLQKFVRMRPEGLPWQTNERLLVAISHSPYSEKLIRATRRYAYNLEAPWIALHVDTGISLNDIDQAQLIKNLNLARELKAETITTTEVDVPSAVKRVCRQKNVTQVIVGRPTRRWFRDVVERGNLLERLVSGSSEVDVHVIRQETSSKTRPRLIDEISYYRSKTGRMKYWYTTCSIAAVSLLGYAILPLIGYRSVGFLFLLAVICVGMFGSIGVVALAAGMSTLIWDYFFIPPKLTFAINNADDFLMCASFFIVALITGFLTNRLRFHERMTREREERTNVLYELLQDIANSFEKSEFIKKVNDRIGNLLEASCGVVLKDDDGKLKFNEINTYSMELADKDRAVAHWSFEHGKQAGWSTDTLSQSSALFLPLKGTSETVGVFIFRPHRPARKNDLERENLLISVVRQLGISIERNFLMRRLSESQRLKDSEELHQTLLNSISHEMRTPLTAIIGSAAALDNDQLTGGNKYVKDIAVGLQEAGDRLNRVIENLLDMSRLNSGVLSLKLDWYDLNDLLNVVGKKLAKTLAKHRLKINYADHLPLAKIDYRLIEHAISNLLVNAAMYTPPETEISVTVGALDYKILLEVDDQGPGIPAGFHANIFNKFYRVPGTPTGGTGLGLSIVKSIIELHHGKVTAESLQPHGTRFRIELPLDPKPQLAEEIAR